MPATVTRELPVELESDCRECATRLQDDLKTHDGVVHVSGANSGRSVSVEYDPAVCSPECLDEAAEEIRRQLDSAYEHDALRVSGMDCADCAQTIERAVNRVPGVSTAHVNFSAASLKVEYEASAADGDRVAKIVERLGYSLSPLSSEAPEQAEAESTWRAEAPLFVGAVLLAIALVLDLATNFATAANAFFGASALIAGVPIARSGITALVATRRPDIKFLMTVAVIGAVAIGAWLEAALVVVLFAIGEFLEGRSVERARRELSSLVALAPEWANVRRSHKEEDGGEEHFHEVAVPVSELVIGDEFVVRPGESIPADGAVVTGESAVDQATITGESTPVDKSPDDELFAGTLNGQGMLVARVTAAPGDSTLDKIARLVTEAQANRSNSERWVDSFARIYTPVVMVVALLVATIPPALFDASLSDSVYSALALLILACPCALVISTPVAIVSALARASAAGVLVKGGSHLERAASITTVAFDKTGTLTEGRPEVTAISTLGSTEDELLGLAASLEQGSEHPIAKAIVRAARNRELATRDVADFEALVGMGARGTVDAREITVGNARLFADRKSALDPSARQLIDALSGSAATGVVVEQDGQIIGSLSLTDVARPEAKEAIVQLRALGITDTVMLTGDNVPTAEAIAAELGVSRVMAELLPQDKVAAIESLGGTVAMVGDGVNDAPALAAAPLGFAMGSAGSATAIEVADVALMGDDPRKVAGLVGVARWTRSVVRQNIAFSLGTKAIALAFLAAGALPLWAAVATDVGASLIVVANSLRLVRQKPRGSMRQAPMLEKAKAAVAPDPEIASKTGECCDSC